MPKSKKKPKKSFKDFPEQKVIVIISIILLVLIIFSASFFRVFFDKSFYDKSFDKHGVYDELGVIGVRKTIDYLINYLTSENSEMNTTSVIGFSSNEQTHLNNVWSLVHTLKIIGIASLVVLIGLIIRLSKLKDFKDNLRRILIYGSIITLALLAIIFLLSLNFPAFFEGFHRILFPQGNYTFPSSALLIRLFPEAFFQDYAKSMMFNAAILSLIILFLGSSSAFAFNKPRRH
jgi:integral membrane protein (TIGR01906 family)